MEWAISRLTLGLDDYGETSRSTLDCESIQLKENPSPNIQPPSKATPPKNMNKVGSETGR